MDSGPWMVASWDDPDLLAGSSVAAVLQEIAAKLGHEQVVVSGFEGKGERVDRLPARGVPGRAIPCDALLSILADVAQVEWCDFYFAEAQSGEPWWDADYRDALPHAECLVRAVDGQSFFVYTKREPLIELIQRSKRGVTVERRELDEITFPW